MINRDISIEKALFNLTFTNNYTELNNLLEKHISKISLQCIENTILMATFGISMENISPKPKILSVLLEKAGNKITENFYNNLLSEVIYKRQNFDIADVILKSKTNKNDFLDNNVKIAFIAGFGNNSELQCFFEKNENLPQKKLLTLLKFAKFKNNKSTLMPLLVKTKECITENDIDIVDILCKGDVFYGISQSRYDYMKQNKISFNDFIIDNINNQLINSTSSIYPLGKYLGLNTAKSDQAREHFSFLEKHNKYNPYLVPEDSKFLRDIRVKRSCKGGIERVVHNEKDNKIFFILDGIDPIRALNKTDQVFSFSSCEFRKIYREFIKSPKLTDKNIIFVSANQSFLRPSQLFKSLEGKHHYAPKILRNIKDFNVKNLFKNINNNPLDKKNIFFNRIEKSLENPVNLIPHL